MRGVALAKVKATIPFLLGIFLLSSPLHALSSVSQKRSSELTKSLSFDDSDLILDTLESACPASLQRLDLRKKAKVFTEKVKQTVKDEILIDVGYCHFYEECGLWYCRLEAQATKKMTLQMAEFAVVKTVEVFLRELSNAKELSEYLRVEPICLYHLQMVINAPDEKGYVREISSWNGKVTFQLDNATEITTFGALRAKLNTQESSESLLKPLSKTEKARASMQQLFSGALFPELEKFWLSKGYIVGSDSWGYLSRFGLPKDSPYFFLHLSTAPALRKQLKEEKKENDIEFFIDNFETLHSLWRKWLLDQHVLNEKETLDLKQFSLVWQHPYANHYQGEIKVFNIGEKVCLYSPKYSGGSRLFSFFNKKRAKEYFYRTMVQKPRS